MNKLKKVWFGVTTFFLTAPVAFAAQTYTPPSNKDGGETIVDSVDSLGTILYNLLVKILVIIRTGLPFITFVVGAAGWWMGNNYVKKKAEQNNGQEAPSVIRLGVPLVGAIAGLAIVFVVVGIFGKVFLNLSASEAWDWAIQSVLGQAGGRNK